MKYAQISQIVVGPHEMWSVTLTKRLNNLLQTLQSPFWYVSWTGMHSILALPGSDENRATLHGEVHRRRNTTFEQENVHARRNLCMPIRAPGGCMLVKQPPLNAAKSADTRSLLLF